MAYAGRSLDDGEPRYLFPPGFPKSQVVFNLHRALWESARWVLVVEGFFDCLRVHQAGYRNVVALLGVSLSEMQEKLLLERFPRLVLMLDGDEAGQRASHQLAARLHGRVSLSTAVTNPAMHTILVTIILPSLRTSSETLDVTRRTRVQPIGTTG